MLHCSTDFCVLFSGKKLSLSEFSWRQIICIVFARKSTKYVEVKMTEIALVQVVCLFSSISCTFLQVNYLTNLQCNKNNFCS